MATKYPGFVGTAYRRAVSLDERGTGTVLAEVDVPPRLLDECVEGWGMELLAYLLGAGAEAPLAQWRLARALDDQRTRVRLLALHDLLELFGDARVARAWVRGIRPELEASSQRNGRQSDARRQLGARSPAALIRGGEDLQ